MVAFKYGEWDYICRVSPQAICNLFYRQLLVHPDRGIEAAPDRYLDLPMDQTERDRTVREAGLGIRPSCSIPRMHSVGGLQGSVGNIADIIFCCISILVTFGFIFQASKRKAAVARIEMIIFLIIFNMIKFFEILDTGSILRQGSKGLVWITSIHQSLVVLFFFVLVWLGFLSLQKVEDGTKLSLVPLFSSCSFLFIGSVYIFLDTGFGVTHYFSSQPASHLYSPWTFSMVILWPLIATTIYVTLTMIVSIGKLREMKPAIFTMITSTVIIIGETFRWVLNEGICRSSSGTLDGSFVGSLFELIAVSLVMYVWTCLTESEWEEEEEYDDIGFQSHKFSNQSPFQNDPHFFQVKPLPNDDRDLNHPHHPDLLPLNPFHNRDLPSPHDPNKPSSFLHS